MRRAGKLAVFDIDGTLVRYSTERAFGRYLLRRGVIGPRQALSFLGLGLRSLPAMRKHTLKKNKGYLAGLRIDEIELLAAAFVSGELSRGLVRPVLSRLEQHLEQGDFVVILSGTLDAIARAIADQLGAQRAVGTMCASRDGVFLAALPLMHPFGPEKLEQTRRIAEELGLGPADVVAYANSADDLDLLRYAGTPVAVLPDRALRTVAKQKGWEIIDEARHASYHDKAHATR